MGKHSTTPETEGRSRACPFLASGTPSLISESENTPFRPLAEESKTNPDLKPTVGLGNYARPVAPLSPPALPQRGEARLPVSAPPSRCGKERAADGGRRTQKAHPTAGPGRAVTAAALLPPPRRPQPRQRLLRQRHRQRPFPFPAGIAPRRTAPQESTAAPGRRLPRPQPHPALSAPPRPLPTAHLCHGGRRSGSAGRLRGPSLATSPAPPAFRHTPRPPPGGRGSYGRHLGCGHSRGVDLPRGQSDRGWLPPEALRP